MPAPRAAIALAPVAAAEVGAAMVAPHENAAGASSGPAGCAVQRHKSPPTFLRPDHITDQACALLLREKPYLNQPPDRFGAGGFGVGLAGDPGRDGGLLVRVGAQRDDGTDAGSRTAAGSFLFDGY